VTDYTPVSVGSWEVGYRNGRQTVPIQIVMVDHTPMAHRTAQAFIAMRAAAAADGIRLTLVPRSGFRPMWLQEQMFAEYLARGRAMPRVADPGYSNHQDGSAVDIASANGPPYIAAENNTYKWLSGTLPGQTAKASDFGFDHREGASVSEPWHWTFLLGRPNYTTSV
jgi:LAS superfamily LD-carboxypeptidase LdcB